jgi:ankyrin repeat protein
MKSILLQLFIILLLASQNSYGGEIHLAATSGDVNKIKELISKGQDIEAMDSDPLSKYDAPKGTPLHWAAKAGKTEVVKFLIEKGASVNALTYYGDCTILESPLDYAVMGKHKKIVIILLEAGSDVESAGHNFHWPLQSAVKIGAIDIADILLNHGARINRSGVDGYTALHHAILERQVDSVEFLLSKGADPNFRDKRFGEYAQTPLQTAKLEGYKEIIKLLIKYGAKE